MCVFVFAHLFDIGGTILGYFVYAESSYGLEGHIATLKFSFLKSEDKNGVEFYYHMKGRDIGTLKVSKYFCVAGFAVLFA